MKTLCAAVAAVFADAAIAQSSLAPQTLPTVGVVTAGTAKVGAPTTSTSGVAQMTVTQTSQRALIDWTTFHVGSNAALTFDQRAGNSSITANRVPASAGQSVIDGLLSANGTVMILNPNGVLFGTTASVNVGGLIASSGNVDEKKIKPDVTSPIAITGAKGGEIKNKGAITVAGAGLAAFVAPSVSNSGTIVATGGRIVLASAQAATISMNAGLYEIAINQGVANGTLANTGTLSTGSAAGSIVLSALDAANIVSGAINLEGIQQASRIEVHGGHVVLKSDLDAAVVTGTSKTIDVCNCGHIQDGIDIAASGATVNVSAGTYAEQLTITKSLSLLGAGADQTIIAPTSLAAGANGMRNILTIGGGAATNAEVSGFTFKGPVLNIDTGIFVRDGAHANIHGNRVIDIRNDPLDGVQSGVGIFVGRAKFGTSGTAQIANNVITGYQKGGIVVDGPGSQATITGNTVIGDGETSAIAQNGIQVSRGANGTVSGNTVSGHIYTGSHADPDNFASGIMFFISDAYLGQGGVTIGPNTVTGNEYGIWTNDSRTLATTSLSGVSGNTRNAVAFLNGGYAKESSQLKYPAWSSPSTTFANSGAFSGVLEGTIADAGGGALGVAGWSGFTAIQPAIDAVIAGGTVNVSSGTYTQATTLNVNKSMTLSGAGKTQTTIDSRGVTAGTGSYGISVTADDVTLKDFTIYGPSTFFSSAYGIKVAPIGGTAARLHHFTIQNVASRGAGKAELDLNGVFGATIDSVTADGMPVGATTGTTAGAGIQITDSADVTIKNSTTLNNAWGGVALFQTNRFFDQQTANITVQNNNTFKESNPLYLQDESASKNFGALNLPGFGYAVRNKVTADSAQFTWMQRTSQDAFDYAVKLPSFEKSYVQGWSGSALQTFHVGFGHLAPGGSAQAMSIMTAIDRADPGALINVYPGAYTEKAVDRVIHTSDGNGHYADGVYTLGLFLYKNDMTLRGVDSSGNTITNANNVQAWITAGAAPGFGMNHGVVANNVTIEGLGFKPYVPNANKTIEIAGDNFTFRNSVVDNRTASGAGALYFGELDPAGHQIAKLTVTGSKFFDGSVSLQNGVGVAADHVSFQPAADRVISNNTFVGSANYSFGGLLLTGKMTEISWRKDPIGGATVAGNSFSGFDDSVLVRGDQQGVDLRQVMRDNSFDRSVLVTDRAGNARGELYASHNDVTGEITMRPKYSIQPTIQAGLNRSVSGDTVAVGTGMYAESVVLDGPRNLTFNGSTIQGLTINPGAAGSGIGGSATANTSLGFRFNAPVVLLSNTTLSTTGASITFNGDIQGAYALSLMAGSGDITLASGGTASNPLGHFDSTSDDFTLSGTLWVTGFNIGAAGNVALSDHPLHGTRLGDLNTIHAGAKVDGTTVSASPLIVEAGVKADMNIGAPSGSSVHAPEADIKNIGSSLIAVNGKPEVPTALSASTGPVRMMPSERTISGNSAGIFQAQSVASAVDALNSLPASAAGEVLDVGRAVEIDLTPGNKRRR